jgi:hypothetical protein
VRVRKKREKERNILNRDREIHIEKKRSRKKARKKEIERMKKRRKEIKKPKDIHRGKNGERELACVREGGREKIEK